LKCEFEDTQGQNAVQQDMRNKREQEVAQLKKALEEETKTRDTQLQETRQKHAQQVEQVNNELDNVRKVFIYLFIYLFIIKSYTKPTSSCKRAK